MSNVGELGAFYSPPNEVDLATLAGTAGDLVGILSARLEDGRERSLLPARINGLTRWYGIARTDRDLRLLFEEMQAWLGPPVSPGVILLRTARDQMDQAAQALTPNMSVLCADVGAGWHGQARENISSLLDTWSLAPERGLDQPRPVGRILRQFYESLLAKDRTSAESALDEIKARSLLSPTNVRFLRIELISAVGTPSELVHDPSLHDITLTTRPPAVTDRLAVAADALLIAPALESGSDVVWSEVAEQLEDLWPGLVTHPDQILSLAGARCLALAESIASEPRAGVWVDLVHRWPDDPVVQALVDVETDEAVDASTGALDHYRAGEYVLALGAVELADPDRSLAAIALHAAVNLGDGSSATRALAVLDRLSEESRTELLGQAVERVFHDQLRSLTADDRIPVGWIEWLTGEWPDRPDLLREWATRWNRTAEGMSRESETLAGELLDALNDERRGRVRNGLPVLIEWLLGTDGLDVGLVPLASTIFDIMLSSEPGRIERLAGLELLDELLGAGCSRREYAEVIEALRSQFGRIGPRDANWLVSSLDVLLLSSSPDPQMRVDLLIQALSEVQSWGDRLTNTDKLLLSKLFGDAGLDFPVRVDTEEIDVASRKGRRPFRKVGIYSLLEPAAQAAARWITEIWPGTEVLLTHDHVSTRSLEALVRSADVMLLQTSHAKHAASKAVAEAAADKSAIVYVSGRGATSLVRGLIHWSEGETL